MFRAYMHSQSSPKKVNGNKCVLHVTAIKYPQCPGKELIEMIMVGREYVINCQFFIAFTLTELINVSTSPTAAAIHPTKAR